VVSLAREDFAAFFSAVHDGHRPFAWQERLLDEVLARGWPDTVDAPTGSGKTAVIDVHVFALALAQATGGTLPPRRLAMIVGRRVLVDGHYEHARSLQKVLTGEEQPKIVRDVAAALRSLSDSSTDDPLVVARLRGGMPPSRRWVDHPDAAAVLCATPEMWGSRLLFRGYGSSSRAWPREAGLLAVDSVAVVDEAHIARQLLHTARRVATLATKTESDTALWRSPLQVVETTATPGSGEARRIGVEEADLADEPLLAARLRRPKPVELVPRADWNRNSVARELARRTAALHADTDDTAGRTVGCFVNTVDRAVAVAGELREQGLTVVLICGQVRPFDLERLQLDYPGLLSVDGNDNVDVIVSTQTLEVGVDLDLRAVVTELAPGSALAQRVGRVNRRGLRPTGPVVVVTPDDTLRTDARSGPYDHTDLAPALDWIRRRAGDPVGLAPWALRSDPPPPAARRRVLWQRPELANVWQWARTSDELATTPDLDLWLSEDFEPDHVIGLVVRDQLLSSPVDPVELVRILPPRRHEVFGVPLRTARAALSENDTRARKADGGAGLRGVVVRGDDVGPLDWTNTENGRRPELRPGDVIVLDTTVALFTAPGTRSEHTSPQVVTRPERQADAHTAADVLEAHAQLGRDLSPGEVVHRITVRPGDALATALTPDEDEPERTQEQIREAIAAFLATGGGPIAAQAHQLLTGPSATSTDVIVLPDDDVPQLVLVIDGRRAISDDDLRQEWTPKRGPVLLENHQQDVADRAAALATRLGLPENIVMALRLAGLHHDDGKADKRFQIRLDARAGEILAKSRSQAGPATVRRRHNASGLPPQWRHEQRSVIAAWPNLPVDRVDRDLVARLIGTSHGHGRAGFPHNSAALLHTNDSAEAKQIAAALFDEGEWDTLIEQTHLGYGAWGCAYLEAVLRAADGQISAEGR
jgi:CRISPR-associated endonuclease/helicase Cas3